MADVNKQCKTCFYWMNYGWAYGSNKSNYCHHILCAGKRRVEEDGVCKSWKGRKKRWASQ